MRLEREAPRVRRSGLRGKEVRWAPTTAMSMVVVLVALLLAMVGWMDGRVDVCEDVENYWGVLDLYCRPYSRACEKPGENKAKWALRCRCRLEYI